MKFVAWFKELSKKDIGLAGGKGANLGEMYNARFPIPPGFVVTSQAYKYFLDVTGIGKEIFDKLAKLDVEDTAELEKTAKEIQELILDQDVPEEIALEIKRAYENLNVDYSLLKANISKDALSMIKAGREIPYVAVRSSATAEDLPQASFAGQQETFLNVKGAESIVRAVQKCWASLFTARAIYYRVRNNFPHEKVLIAVIVQKMVDADVSGVTFSINPVTNNRNEILIEAAFGLGEAVVGGQVKPDEYIVDKTTFEIKSKKINTQPWMYVRDEITRRTVKKSLTEAKGSEQKLPDDKIVELARIVKRIEDHYGNPQDIEFAVENGRIYIVQSRAVTTIQKVEEVKKHEEIKLSPVLEGIAASPGIGIGKVKVVHSIEELSKVQPGDVLVTVMTNPDYVVTMQKCAAIVTDEGGITAHAAIVSREMGIPCVVGTVKATSVLKDGQIVTVDGTRGKVYLGSVKEVLEEVTPPEKPAEKPLEVPTEKLPVEGQELPVIQIKKGKTKIYMNLGEPEKIDAYKNLPFDGIGLMRLEFLIASEIGEHPNYLLKIGEQEKYVNKIAEGIKKVASAIYPKPVIVRFSDFKSNEYRDLKGGGEFEPHEANPMIGWRGVSRYISPEFKEAFKLECRAIKRVRDDGLDNVYVMLPFVRTPEEVIKCLEIMKEVGLERSEKFKVWIMAEVPSVALTPQRFASLSVDGCSIGSNDLTQLVLGVDRDSALLGKLGYFDERNPAVLKAIENIVKTFLQAGKTVSICGQAPSVYPEIVEFLVKLGITSISVNPDVVEKTRNLVVEIESKLSQEQS